MGPFSAGMSNAANIFKADPKSVTSYLGCGKLIVCVASLESTPDSLTQGCKVQECKQQVMSYKLLFLGICVLFLNPCSINNFLPAFPINYCGWWLR
jgi:hypothetical protein